jgi:hypothetical protein
MRHDRSTQCDASPYRFTPVVLVGPRFADSDAPVIRNVDAIDD